MTKTRELSDVANDMACLDSTIGLMENYISCLQIQSKNAKTKDDRYLVLYSLTGENGFDNLLCNLENIRGKINSLTNEIGDYAKRETR